jgi:hypothetical protein
MNSVAERSTPVTRTAPTTPPALTQAVRVMQLAERLLQVQTDDPQITLGTLTPRDRARYGDAAAVALALIVDEPPLPALYAAAHRLVDLGSQTPVQRRGLVQMVAQVVERYLEVLAGHRAHTVDQLAPLVAIDRAGADVPEGVM